MTQTEKTGKGGPLPEVHSTLNSDALYLGNPQWTNYTKHFHQLHWR
jgi:hypothetical protein